MAYSFVKNLEICLSLVCHICIFLCNSYTVENVIYLLNNVKREKHLSDQGITVNRTTVNSVISYGVEQTEKYTAEMGVEYQ